MAPSASPSSSFSSPWFRRPGAGDTAQTKVFVGGLAWETTSEELHRHFQRYGLIAEAVVIADRITGRSKGYGFVTFSDAEAARRSVMDPNPVINGRRANCNIASLGRPRPSPPRARNLAGFLHAVPTQAPGPSYGRLPAQKQGLICRNCLILQVMYSPPMADPSYYHQLYSPASSPNTHLPHPPSHHAHMGYTMTDPGASFPSALAVPYQPLVQYSAARIEQSYHLSSMLSPSPHSSFILQPQHGAGEQLIPTSTAATDSQLIPSAAVAETNVDSTDS